MYGFRHAKEEDAKKLAELRQKVWAENYRGIFHDRMIDEFDFELHENKFITQIKDIKNEIIIIEKGGNQIGYFCISNPNQESLGRIGLRLNSLYILSEYQKKGIGTNVFSYIREYCSKKNITFFYNSCNMHNSKAIEYNKKMGGRIVYEDSGHEEKFEDQIYFEYRIVK